jgi:glutathione synthase
MKIFIQMDDPSGFNAATDSTMALALEAQARGFELYYFLPSQLTFSQGRVVARARPVEFFDRAEDFFIAGDAAEYDLETVNLVLIRQEPPYDMQYLSNCWLLERLQNPLILNNPAALGRRPEKLFPLALSHYAPPTVITYSADIIRDFYAEYQDIILKPLYAHGGYGIVRIQPQDVNFNSLLTMLLQSREAVIAQPFLPEVMTEEKRVLLIDGAVAGAYNRIPQRDDFRANSVLGGGVEKTTLNARQQEVCEAVVSS